MSAIKRGDVKIYVVDANTAPSALAATDIIAGEIISYEQSGGTREVETQPAFGGDIDKEKPTEQFELTFEFVPDITTSDRWEKFIYARDLTVTTGNPIYTSAQSVSSQPNDKMIVVQALQGTVFQTHMFNNCNVTNLDMSHSADDNRTGTMTFKFSPTTRKGVANYQSSKRAATAMPAFTALDNN